MKPVKQTKFGQGRGNCFTACVASVLELELEAVPDFCLQHGDGDWFLEFNAWLRVRFGLGALLFDRLANEVESVERAVADLLPDAYMLMSGPTSRGKHVVVYRRGKLVWDPHPSGEGLREIRSWMVFVAADPSVQVRGHRS